MNVKTNAMTRPVHTGTYAFALIALFMLLSVWLALPVHGQNARPERRGDPEQRIEHRLQMLERHLDLSDAQEAQIRQLWAEQHEAARTWREANPDATREERQAHRKAQAESHRAALEAVLTPDQAAQLEQLEETGRERIRSNRRRGFGQRGPGNGFGEKLNLTEAQRTQLREVQQTHRADLRAWMEAHPNATREERQAHRKAQAEAMKSTLAGILTPEQKARYETMKAERKERFDKQRGRRGQAGRRMNAVSDTEAAEVNRFDLSNYPNPFNPSTEIRFELPEAAHVSLVVYDVQGRSVATLIDEQRSAGTHAATFDATGLPTGTYLYRLSVGSVTQTGRMVLMK